MNAINHDSVQYSSPNSSPSRAKPKRKTKGKAKSTAKSKTKRRKKSSQISERHSTKRIVGFAQKAAHYRFTVRFTIDEWKWLGQHVDLQPNAETHAVVIRTLIEHHLRCGLLSNYQVATINRKEQPYVERTVWLASKDALKLKILAARRGVSMAKALRILVNILGPGSHITVTRNNKGNMRVIVTSLKNPKARPDIVLDQTIKLIQKIIKEGLANSLPAEEISQQLKEVANGDEDVSIAAQDIFRYIQKQLDKTRPQIKQQTKQQIEQANAI